MVLFWLASNLIKIGITSVTKRDSKIRRNSGHSVFVYLKQVLNYIWTNIHRSFETVHDLFQ